MLLRKRVCYTLFLLILCSCSKSCPNWKYCEVRGCREEFSSARVTYRPATPCNAPELELINTACGCKMYLNVFSLEVPCLEHDPHTVMVTLTIDGLDTDVAAYRLQGGNRVLFPDDVRDIVIDALLYGKTVHLSTGRYDTTITPVDFCAAYNKLYR